MQPLHEQGYWPRADLPFQLGVPLIVCHRLGEAHCSFVPDPVFEDLRQGRISLEVRQPAAVQASERLGRRLFAAVVVGALILAGAGLLAADHKMWGGLSLGAAATLGLIHWVSMALNTPR